MPHVVSRDGTRIAYDKLGNGPTLIYITGAICFRKFMPIVADAKSFAAEFTVYNYDRRGRGDSGDTLPYSIDKEVDDIEALIDAAGGKAFLYGHSSGAVLALEAALRLPHKVVKAALYDAPYVHDENERVAFGKLAQSVATHLSEKLYTKALQAFVIGIKMPKIMAYLLPLMPGWSTMKALAPTLAYDIALTKDLPDYKRLAGITVHIKIMYGGKNPPSIKSVAQGLSTAIPSAQVVELKKQDHMISVKVLLPLLKDFFKS